MKTGVVASLLILAPRAALACPVCFGQNDSPMAAATNMGIIVMLGVIAVVLGGFAYFIVHLNRQARLAAAARSVPTGGGRYVPSEGTAPC
jgi:hypothetical protein